MNQQQMNMGGIGGPIANQPANHGTPNAPAGSSPDTHRVKLHTYIYDYFLKNQYYDLARSLHNTVEIEQAVQPKQSPSQRKEVNGDAMDTDSKDNLDKKPDDLPDAQVPNASDSAFLFDWWCQFWDMYQGQRGRGTQATKQYLNQVQQQARVANDRQRMMRMDPQMQNNMGVRNAMMQNGVVMPPGMPTNRNATPQQIAQMQQYRRTQAQLAQTQQMQREGSQMAGQQGPQSPSSADAPSPKRQRLDGQHFNGQPIGPMGRGQPQGLQAQQGQQVGPSDPDQLMKQLVSYGINPNSLSPSQFNNLQMQNPNVQAKSMQVYAQSMRQQMQNALESNAPKGMPNPAGMVSQGSPAMDANPEFFNGQMRVMPGAAANAANNSNHALQDYQMQLMLLEQQNKKRLLMARQEQDNMTSGPGGPVPPGQPGFAPAMSPQNSRAGPSPNPNEQMKRGTPKMAPGAVPSPTPDGGMPQGRASPAPGFDPNQMNPNMPPNMYNHQMGMRPGMMPNGQMMQPPSSHPGFNGQLNPQQMEMMRQSGGRLPNGQPFPPNPQGMMMPGQPQQPQPPNMTPQQRNAAMPPPPAPPGGQPGGTQPSSPQPNAPPTPSQANKPNPKKKNDPKSNKKAPAKKGGATAATPASEAEQPPTPTPNPPITPTAAQGFNQQKNGVPQPNAQPNQGPPNGMPPQAPQPDMGVNGGPFGNLGDGNFQDMNLDFGAIEGQDVLDNFDFDSFLNNDGADFTGFDNNFLGGDAGLEAGGDL